MAKLENFGHTLQVKGPGSLWHANRISIIRRHKALVPNMLTPCQYHVFVKYAYADAVIGGDKQKLTFWKTLYEKMQLKRVGSVKTTSFDALIYSLQMHGYNESFPIPISNQNLEILDGSHRLGACMALSIWPYVEIYDTPSHSYDRGWFEQNGFNFEELNLTDEAQKAIMRKVNFNRDVVRVGTVWGNALNYWNQILEMLKKHNLKVGIWIDLGSIDNTEQFVIESYAGDGMDKQRIVEKAKKLAHMSTLVGLFIIEDKDDRAIGATKHLIRDYVSPKLEGYFFDSVIHIIDSRPAGLQLLDKNVLDKGRV